MLAFYKATPNCARTSTNYFLFGVFVGGVCGGSYFNYMKVSKGFKRYIDQIAALE